MSQQRGSYNDSTFTKIFVGGLAWETQRDTMRHYFEQFGDILEAVVITDKNTGKSKGYGFVTFMDPEAAMRACQNPSPVIDGRRANCNLASLGASKIRAPNPHHHGRFRSGPRSVVPPFHQPTGQYTFPYSGYGYPGYSQDSMYPLNYYSLYGGQQISPYYGASGSQAIYQNLYPFYGQNSQLGHGLGVPYSQMLHYPYMPQSAGPLALPSSLSTLPISSGASVEEQEEDESITTIPIADTTVAVEVEAEPTASG